MVDRHSNYVLSFSHSLNSLINYMPIKRSSRPEVFCKKGALRNFTKFTGKHPCQSLFFNKEIFNINQRYFVLFDILYLFSSKQTYINMTVIANPRLSAYSRFLTKFTNLTSWISSSS